MERNGEPSAFDIVPYDIIVDILKALDSFESLQNLIRTSSLFYNAFFENADTITRGLAYKQFPPEAFRVLNLCRPPYENASRPEDLNEVRKPDVEPTEIPPVPVVTTFARRFIRGTKSTATVRSDIGKIDSDLSPDPTFIGYYETRRLCNNRKIINLIVEEVKEIAEEQPEGTILPERMLDEDEGYEGCLERAVYNIYFLGSLVYSVLPFAFHNYKLADVVGIDCLPVLDIPYRIIDVMVCIMEAYGAGYEDLEWDLPILLLGRCTWFPHLRQVAMATQLLALDTLALEGKSKPYGKETSRAELKLRVEILRSILMEEDEEDAEYFFRRGFFQLIHLSWTTIQLDAHYDREILINSYNDDGMTPLLISSRHAFRHRYLSWESEPEKGDDKWKSWKKMQAQAWQDIEGLNKAVGQMLGDRCI
ncbi:hypothetical protein BJ508DRAFT_418639 [Ascobolus immersus RN42]|uniref:F-box domain-containing protein n=1 Tax=Ascobolus immersus RN42 TaxID=1160509 RepID=A0A3N4HQR7_ASCIM|nr:hypothetical protein BJ508DRAFT_418639 [Ascobolus immersus RN42]